MNLGQTIVYSLKPFASTALGNFARDQAKGVGGAIFDLFFREYRTDQCVFSVPRSYTTRRMRAKFLLDTYELPERTLAKQHIRPHATVLELGSSLGILSCIVNRRLADPSRHVAVEINPSLIQCIEKNRVQNDCQFHIEHCAVTKRHALLFEPASDSDSGKASVRRGTPAPVRDLFDIERAYGLRFDTIVLDIEGAEIEFIAEYDSILPRVNTIIVEFHPSIVGEDKTRDARGRIIGAGLKSVGKMLEVEAFVRPAT